MAKFEEKKERSIIFMHEGSKCPRVKCGYFTDSEWRKIIFTKFDANERDYIWINDCVILVMIEKGN